MNKIDSKYHFKDYLKLAAQGFCIGIANAIPGVSGGTVAFLFGIYEDLINAIKSFDLNLFKKLCAFEFKAAFNQVAWRFLLAILFGAIIAILCFSQLISWLLVNKPVYVNAFFFGLILASIPIIARVIRKWNIGVLFNISISILITNVIVQSVPLNTPDSLLFIFLCGVLAISSMILPGLSGAFILVLLGKYTYIINAINDKNFVILAVFTLGLLIGILTFVRVLSWLFARYHDATIACLTGLVIGSLSKIWPWKRVLEVLELKPGKIIAIKEVNTLPASMDQSIYFAIGLMIIGMFLTLWLNQSSSKA